jgi:hypothetical protein
MARGAFAGQIEVADDGAECDVSEAIGVQK